MMTIGLMDHELPLTDFSNFELKLKAKGGNCTAEFNNWTTPQGTAYIRLTGPAVEFDEAQSSEEDMERFLKAYGFQRKSS